tara:strand:+ start:1109 stop:1555 length:447 start_codon:yes stop_codon:yes gene_type:complete
MGDYKDKNGTTRVGDFLRDLDLNKSLEVVGNLVKGDIKGAISVISNSDTLSPEQRQHALELIRLDMEDMKGVSQRWTADMSSDSTLSKNVRPLTLIFLTVVTVIFIASDSYFIDFNVDESWIELLKTLLLSVFIAYFGGRSYEKGKKL